MSDQQNLRDLIQLSEPSHSEDQDPDARSLFEQTKEKQKLENDRYKSNTNDRKWLAEWSAAIVSLWLFLVFIILIQNSSNIHLSDSVLNVLLGTTTLNVLGLVFIVLRGHFGSGKE